MPEGYVTVNVEGTSLVTISNGDTVFDIVGSSSEMYPELPYVERRDELSCVVGELVREDDVDAYVIPPFVQIDP